MIVSKIKKQTLKIGLVEHDFLNFLYIWNWLAIVLLGWLFMFFIITP